MSSAHGIVGPSCFVIAENAQKGESLKVAFYALFVQIIHVRLQVQM
jgi:hypothetical protein